MGLYSRIQIQIGRLITARTRLYLALTRQTKLRLRETSGSISFTISDSVAEFNASPHTLLKRIQLEREAVSRIVVSGIVRDSTGRILIIQRVGTGRQPDRWEILGGKLEATDLTPHIKRTVGSASRKGDEAEYLEIEYPDGRQVWAKFTFEILVKSPERVALNPEEHQNFLWVTEEQVRQGQVGDIKLEWTCEEQKETILEAFRL